MILFFLFYLLGAFVLILYKKQNQKTKLSSFLYRKEAKQTKQLTVILESCECDQALQHHFETA